MYCRRAAAGWATSVSRPPPFFWACHEPGGLFYSSAHHLVDISQQFGDRAVEAGWDFLAYLGALVQGLCKGRVLDERDVVIDGALADAEGQIVLALGHYQGRRHGVVAVADGNRVVRRVYNHGSRGRDLAHHLAPPEVPLQTPDARFD